MNDERGREENSDETELEVERLERGERGLSNDSDGGRARAANIFGPSNMIDTGEESGRGIVVCPDVGRGREALCGYRELR